MSLLQSTRPYLNEESPIHIHVGFRVGCFVGERVGNFVGDRVGLCVGNGLPPLHAQQAIDAVNPAF